MYLKRLELIGFKSFAEPTVLEFGPGIMAIVGPNGCGKSNIADAIRWVLGEQSAKALRGTRMEDCIFNGTDAHPPLNMAEVSLTLADCEGVLGVDFHEVTITRRVFRSGESEYLINKTPCRLRDLQRLFMGTGIGTQSYSLMEQGRIDRVLSSRPEDRRSVFEEASGVTKFKADKKEALRKLEQTEANLLRLGDLLREIRRQIILLQRQAGKARRYQALQRQLRSVELYWARTRLAQLDAEIGRLELRRSALQEREEAEEAAVREAERAGEATMSSLEALDRVLEQRREAAARARAEQEQWHATLRLQEDRIRELAALAERDESEAERYRAQRDALGPEASDEDPAVEQARAACVQAEADWQRVSALMREAEQRVDAVQRRLQEWREEALNLEHRLSRAQAELSDWEARQRAQEIRHEKLLAEKADLEHQHRQVDVRRAELENRLAEEGAALARFRQEEEAAHARLRECAAAVERLRREIRQRETALAGLNGRIELLERQEQEAEGFPGGAKWLLVEERPAELPSPLGTLAGHLDVEPAYRRAVEAVLRPWLDAVVVADDAAMRSLLSALAERKAGAARLVTLEGARGSSSDLAFDRLADHVRVSEAVQPLLGRLLGRVIVVGSVADIPPELPEDITAVTPDGVVYRRGGPSEVHLVESEEASLLARRSRLREWVREREGLQRELGELRAAMEGAERELSMAEGALMKARDERTAAERRIAHLEGERQGVEQQWRRLAERIETVALELEGLGRQGAPGTDRAADLRLEMERSRARLDELRALQQGAMTELRHLEQERSRVLAEATQARMQWNDRRSALEALLQERDARRRRREELEALVQQRTESALEHRRRIAELEQAVRRAREDEAALAERVRRAEEAVEEARRRREAESGRRAALEQEIRERRAQLDAIRRERSAVDIEWTELTTRRQALVERIAAEHRVAPEEIARASEPDWEELGGRPADADALEAMIAELRARLDSLGPVNLVAIEEYEALEQRHRFLTQQQEDLLKAKQQLHDLIRRINQTTTAMFRETFDRVNENFRVMFEKLFGGGTAKLVLVDEADILECGIEIIARPPGKRLQSISLLSGGERTMTAVALLFALYLVKPSPFCVLDEMDAALDDTNIGRFISVLRDFLDRSQFIIITHNRQTIAAAHRLFGVTMEQRGISKIVSVRFNEQGRPELAAEGATGRPTGGG